MQCSKRDATVIFLEREQESAQCVLFTKWSFLAGRLRNCTNGLFLHVAFVVKKAVPVVNIQNSKWWHSHSSGSRLCISCQFFLKCKSLNYFLFQNRLILNRRYVR